MDVIDGFAGAKFLFAIAIWAILLKLSAGKSKPAFSGGQNAFWHDVDLIFLDKRAVQCLQSW